MRRHQAHVDAVALAEFCEGLIGGHRAARIQAHLAGCAHCAGIEAGLAGVTALLAAAPQPVMPDGLARRVTEALAAEAAARDLRAPQIHRTSPAIATAAVNGQARAHHPWHAERVRGITERLRGHGRLALRGFAGAAAACLLAAGGFTLARFGPSGTSGASSSGSAGRPVEHAPVHGTRPHQWAEGPTPQVSGTGPAPLFTVVESGTDYEPAPRLVQQVKAELATLGPGGAWRPGSGRHGTMTPAQADCVRHVTGGITPVLVDAAHYMGKPATVIVLAGKTALTGQAWVMGPRCTHVAHVDLPGGP